jgi:hypothetical protein
MAVKEGPSDLLATSRKVAPSQFQSLKTPETTRRETATKGRVDRTSFSSIKESDSGIAQSFTTTKTSSYLRNQYLHDDEAIDDEFSSGSETAEFETVGMLTNPHSLLKPFVCPCDNFKGWKGINIGGRVASKSFGDLKALSRWEWSPLKGNFNQLEVAMNTSHQVKGVDGNFLAGKSPFEQLPMELLSKSYPRVTCNYFNSLLTRYRPNYRSACYRYPPWRNRS